MTLTSIPPFSENYEDPVTSIVLVKPTCRRVYRRFIP